MAKAWVGTSGWSYSDWRQDLYAGIPQAKWLAHFATRFPTVEVNNIFYRLPRKEWVERWAATVPGNFRFALKMWRHVTHYHRLRDVEALLDTYWDVVAAMPPAKRGPILVQLPPQLDLDVEALDAMLGLLRERVRTWPIAVEFRNTSWFADGPPTEVLDAHKAALCVHDMARGAPVQEPNDAPFVYVRRHGPKARYAGSYSDEQVAADAKRIEGWLDGGRDVYVYYNNDHFGNAHRNAASLTEMLDGRAVRPRVRPQQPLAAKAETTNLYGF